MEQTMRWFGPEDPVSLSDIRQAGCEGVVTALHDVPNGHVWSVEAITRRRELIEAHGMRWSVVESLPVAESVKRRSAGCDEAVAAYRESLANLAACGLRTVTYNFMPVLDWTRTDLAYPMPDGALALRFDADALAAFDLHILGRPGAGADYDAATTARAAQLFSSLDDEARHRLERTVVAGLPGSEESFGTAEFREVLATYATIDADTLRSNHIRFLTEVVPTAEELGVRLVVHPDDPPFPLFGLPRVVSTGSDLATLFDAVPAAANGLCFCVGSLGVREDNDLVAMIRRFGSRIGFLHLRNVQREPHGSFHEATHLGGSSDMYAVVREVDRLSRREGRRIPMRPDHGHQMLDDLGRRTNPGYSAIGRLRGLAELRGLEMGVARSHTDADSPTDA
ncbi:mannonate dehydratase [Pseudonocardia sp. HH130630-07]|nr:mannonate dehydratase [Pseudonocardia sp. HH130630-07]